MYLFNNVKFNPNLQCIIDDVQYPAGWFNDPAERAKIGVVEVPDPVRPDDNLYTSVENLDGSYTATPRTEADIAAYKAAKDAEQAVSVRAARDDKLRNICDRVNPMRWEDMTADQKQAQRTYRQALLDLPEQTGFPWTITWPDAP